MTRSGEAVVLPPYFWDPDTSIVPDPLGVIFLHTTVRMGGSMEVTETMHARVTFVPITAE